MDSSAGNSVPLPPSLPTNGSLPARRLQTQVPVSEPPACVQNAMMTKDKKPFTYTPGGIDLSQIKSPRMAKRIARNAQYEGVMNQPKPSPLAQEQFNNSSGNSPPVAPPPPASAMGMPVQVFPTGPPPPPPAPSSNSNIPPPPPPMSAQLTPQSNGRDTRKSPTPQNFEPPPLGCRPEIKIPPNPIATLRKVPKPEPKNDFWIEEYRTERSKSPMAGEQTSEEKSANQPVRQEAPPTVSSPKPTTIASTNNQENDSDPRKDPNRIAFQQQRPQPQQYQPPQQQPQLYQPQQYQPQQTYQPQSPRPIQPNYQQQQQSEPSYPPHMDPNRIAFTQQRQQPSQQQQQKREVSPVRTPGGYYQQQQQRPQLNTMSPNAQRVDSPFRAQDNPTLQRPLSPVKSMNSPPMQQQPQSPYYGRQQHQPQYQPPQQQQQPRQYVTSPPPQQKPAQVGSLYIAPVPPENLAIGSETPVSAGLQQTPPWLAQRTNMKENPEWVREVNSPPAANRTQTPPISQNQTNNGPGLRLQMNQNVTQSNPKERIIPIQIEKTPTPSKTPSTPGFGPQPYSPNNQYGSVNSPGSGYSTPSVNQVRSPNQFVDQGYNSYPNQWQNQQQQQVQQRVVSPPAQQQQGGGRIVPIAIERDEGPFNPNVARGPISPAPMVIQNGNYNLIVHDCPLEAQLRFGKGRLSDPRGGPQSRSPNGMTPNQSKSFRVLQKITDTEIDRDSDSEQPVELHGPQYSKQMGETIDQMRRIQMNDTNQQAFVNRGPIQRQTQRYVQQKPIFQQDDQQQYVHPSEQKAPEPKIYTGSAIPSRSFKLLQAMTTPENAGPGQSDL